MAEIGDVTRFTHRGALTAFAGVDPGVNASGTYEQQSVPTSKHGSPYLRKALFQVMDVLIKTSPSDDAVYAFMDKKIRSLNFSLNLNKEVVVYLAPDFTSIGYILYFNLLLFERIKSTSISFLCFSSL